MFSAELYAFRLRGSRSISKAKEAEPEVHDKACPGVEHALRYRWRSERMIRVDRIGGLQGLPSERVLSSGLLTGYRKYNRPRLSLSRPISVNVSSPRR